MERKSILFCSAGRRAELLKDFKRTLGEEYRLIATDLQNIAPALYFADKAYLVPRIDDEHYIDTILEICEKENVKAITTLIDPEIEVLAKNREKFSEIGVLVLAPSEKTAETCFDKYKMFCSLKEHGIDTVGTYDSFDEFEKAFASKEVEFPVFVKPRCGSGSVGAQKVDNVESLKVLCESDEKLIIQEYMNGMDLDADIYVDPFSHKVVSAFTKRKLETRIGGASKTISFKDDNLFETIKKIVEKFEFYGPIDMDFFYKNGKYYMSEVNPRFGGAYLHAYGCGVDFVQLIKNNIEGVENIESIGEYESDVVMMMYDSVVFCKKDELI